jgi:hypothetical protein
MLSFEKLKEFFILFFSFGIIYLFQYVDDKKRCKKRDGIYDNIKLPLLATSIIGLVLFWNNDSSIIINTPVPNKPIVTPPVNKAAPDFLISNQSGGNIHTLGVSHNLDVYTDLAEW